MFTLYLPKADICFQFLTRVTSHPSLSRTEGFFRIWAFSASDQKVQPNHYGWSRTFLEPFILSRMASKAIPNLPHTIFSASSLSVLPVPLQQIHGTPTLPNYIQFSKWNVLCLFTPQYLCALCLLDLECSSPYLPYPGSSDGKASAYNVGDPGSIPGLGSCPGEANGNPLQYSCLENPMDHRAW